MDKVAAERIIGHNKPGQIARIVLAVKDRVGVITCNEFWQRFGFYPPLTMEEKDYLERKFFQKMVDGEANIPYDKSMEQRTTQEMKVQNVIKLNNTDLGKLADRYGDLKAQIATLEEELNTVKNMLVESEEDVIEGELFRVTVSEVERSTFDTANFKQQHSDLYAMFQKISTCVMVRCGARKGK